MERRVQTGNILIANPGSTSRKYALYRDGERWLSAVDRQREDGVSHEVVIAGRTFSGMMKAAALKDAFEAFIQMLDTETAAAVEAGVIALRVVASGTAFQRHALIDEDYRARLEKQRVLLPLHVNHTLDDLEALQAMFPGAQFIGISDSAFHATQHVHVRSYGLDPSFAAEHDLYRFGYHGLAAASAVRILSGHYPLGSRKLVLCHLGGGTSVMAIENGKSVYASMGFSPLEGPMMATRSGDLDPALAVHLASEILATGEETIAWLSKHGGFKGFAGTTDVQELVQRYEAADRAAMLAVDKYVHDVLKYIGIAMMELQGMDAIVFSGGIGEHAALIRGKILEGLNFLGFSPAGKATVLDERCSELDASNSAIRAFVVKVDEEAVMYEAARDFIASGTFGSK